MQKNLRVFHLSHTDLDGYVCQYLAREFFHSITFFNANYGREVGVRLESILEKITQDPAQKLNAKFSTKLNTQNHYLILITDLNLTLQEAQMLSQRVENLKNEGFDIEICLLDHHISGQECANKFEWYFLDSTRCASRITWQTLHQRYILKDTSKESWLENLSNMTNSVDIWLEYGYKFEFGKVALNAIALSNELNRFMFDNEHREYKFGIIESMEQFLGKENDAVEFDNALYVIKKHILGGKPYEQTMDYITSHAQSKLLSTKKAQCSLELSDKLGFLSYGLGGISVLANLFLTQNPEYDFYMDINNKGNVSLRANGKCDVSALSKEFFNGGGHKNAAGGKLDGFRENFNYDEIKRQVLERFER